MIILLLEKIGRGTLWFLCVLCIIAGGYLAVSLMPYSKWSIWFLILPLLGAAKLVEE